MIYAYSSVPPSSAAPSAILQKHDESGTFLMDLTQPQPTLPTGTNTDSVALPTSTPAPTSVSQPGLSGVALSSDERRLVAHGILMSTGFLVLLPIGALIPRYTRTIPALRNKWFTAHWIVQFLISAPIIITGWFLAYHIAGKGGGTHFSDSHRKVGLALLILYGIQLALGAVIHFFKPNRSKPAGSQATESFPGSRDAKAPVGSRSILASLKARPLQNYLHAILGLTIIGLAFANVREGYREEWERTTGRAWSSTLKSVNAWWISWAVIIPLLYVAGLTLLPRQWRQERSPVGEPIAPGSSPSKAS